MAKMKEDDLLDRLQSLEDEASSYVWGDLTEARQDGVDEYFRKPYGTEQEGWSDIVTSDVQDTVEWILPELLDVFLSSDKAVQFDPTKAEDVDGSKQATQSCNYVFFKKNNGFLVLHTLFKDALITKNCAVMWRKETKRTLSRKRLQGVGIDQIALELEETGGDITAKEMHPLQPMMGPMGPMQDLMGMQIMQDPVFDIEITYAEEQTSVKVEPFPSSNLLVQRGWHSPLLDDCPYVARVMPVTLSDIHEMGFDDVKAEDLAGSHDVAGARETTLRPDKRVDDAQAKRNQVISEDPSQTTGFLRIEFVLVDFDGDGVAERRCVYRLKDKVLDHFETAQVQIATASPILVPHQWDGMSIAEIMADLQQLRTELFRQVMNSAYLANNPRKKVLTDAQGNPRANMDDLLDARPGGIMRQFQVDAISDDVTPFVGGQMFPLLEYIDGMREQRSGVSRVQQGIDPNVLRTNRTLGEARMINQTAKQRIKLIARIFGEILLKPIFLGIFKLLTDGDMERIAFQLNDQFVEYDPNEWRDGYDMTCTVGLGTGDTEQQLAHLGMVLQEQMEMMGTPFGPLLVKPKNVYAALAKQAEAAGFKNAGEFWTDPQDAMPQQPPPPPNPVLIAKQMELADKEKARQADAMKFQAETQREREASQMEAANTAQQQRNELMLQATNDARDAERAHWMAQMEAVQAARDDQTKRWIAGLQAQIADLASQRSSATSIEVAEIREAGRAGDAHMAQQQAEQQPPQESQQ